MFKNIVNGKWTLRSRAPPGDSTLNSGQHKVAYLKPVLWNRNYFLRFRFRLLKSYGSASVFCKVMVPVPVPYLDYKKQIFQKKIWKNFAFLHSKLD
jgi:hypothetical protein